MELDKRLYDDNKILSHKLCGAGNGGYFLVFVKAGNTIQYHNSKKIQISETGIESINLKK
jgi:hypothetical protein